MASKGRDEVVLVETTVPQRLFRTVGGFVRPILNRRLAACANWSEVASLFWWKGRLVGASEFLVSFKTPRRNVDAVVAAIREAHPYDVPYIAVMRLDVRKASYANWVRSEATPTRTGPARRTRSSAR